MILRAKPSLRQSDSGLDMGFRELGLDIFYAGSGASIASKLLLPSLKHAVRYDRLAAYFNTRSLVSIGVGLESLRTREGRVRLVVGAHDVDVELAEAARMVSLPVTLDRLKQRLLEGVATLADELARDRVETVAWMLKDGLLTVRCAGPRVSGGPTGIFHSKRLILVDGRGDIVAATGSPNETVSGLGANYEEVTVHMSWSDPNGYVQRHTERFDDVWSGTDEYLDVVELDEAFADELLAALRPTRASHRATAPSQAERLAQVVWDVLKRCPAYALQNCSEVPLFPHQESVLIEACSRWPIRAVLADEVGLGKTFEAAAAIRFAIQACQVRRVLVLAPPTLLKQWQDELVVGFGLPFYRYDSQRRCYVGPEGEEGAAVKGPLEANTCPQLAIVSRDLVRGTRKKGHAFLDATTFPDLVVLDEAHAVRKRRDASGGSHESLLRLMMAYLSHRVPHILMLTATPLQVDARELYDMLEILGLPPGFDSRAFDRSLQLLATPADAVPGMSVASDALRLISASEQAYLPAQPPNGESEESSQHVARGVVPDLRQVIAARQNWSSVHASVVQAHPAARLVIRNTRGALEKVGYRFPTREFESVEVSATEDVAAVLNDLDEYLRDGIGAAERAIQPDTSQALGFLVSTYRQRVASSLLSARDTLQNRYARIARLVAGGSWADEASEEDDEPFDDMRLDDLHSVRASKGFDFDAVMRACRIELAQIDHIMRRLDRLQPSLVEADPKVGAALDLVDRYRAEGRACLLFSRYTSTIRALIEGYNGRFDTHLPFAVYTGAGGSVWDGTHFRTGSKQLVTNALRERAVSVVFCSDAASEGLNLQTASAMVNVDVPWNPARLEQRIGRIARLGQQASSVSVVNLWYPDSVEAQIYARVLGRRDTIELALGAFPKIVADAIRQSVAQRYRGDFGGGDVLARLQEARESARVDALTKLWVKGETVDGAETTSRRLVARVMQVVGEVLRRNEQALEQEGATWRVPTSSTVIEASSAPGDPDGFTLVAPWLKQLFSASRPAAPHEAANAELGVVSRAGVPLAFATRVGSSISVLVPDALPEVLRAVWLGVAVDLSACSRVTFQADVEVDLGVAVLVGGRWPSPGRMRVPTSVPPTAIPSLPSWAQSGTVDFEPLTHVRTVPT